MKKGKLAIDPKKYSTVFCGAVLASILVWLILSLIMGKELWTSVFFRHTTDAFMDFFNSVRDASLGEGAYTERHVIYPPMANLLFMLASKITPDAYNGTSFEERRSWSEYPQNVALIVAVTAVCAILLLLILRLSLRMRGIRAWGIAAVAFFGIPCLNMLERGNIMILSLVGVMVYALTYHSENKWLRELGLLALAFSFSLKLYPLLFAWILLGDKRYGDFLRCFLYSAVLLILPSFCFGGPRCLLYIVENILFFSSGEKSALAMMALYSGIPQRIVSLMAYAWFAVCALAFAVTPFVHREDWKKWTVGCVVFLVFPSLTSIYAWALFLIPLLMLFDREEQGKRNLAYFIPMALPFLFVPILTPVPVTANTFLAYVCLAALSWWTVIDTARMTVRYLRERSK